jgi:hypothetical protein
MASPAPKYPTVLIANKLASHTLHDSTEVAAPVVGFIPDADGSFSARLRGDTADVTLNVLGGVFYPFDVKLAKATGASGVTALRILRFVPSA